MVIWGPNIAFIGNTSNELTILALNWKYLQLNANITEILAMKWRHLQNFMIFLSKLLMEFVIYFPWIV